MPVPARHPDAVLLDIDDTIVAWSDTIEPAWRQLARSLARKVGHMDAEMLYAILDLERRKDQEASVAELITRAGARLGVHLAATEEARAQLDQARRDALQPLHGAVDAVHAIRRRVDRLGVVSTGSLATQAAKLEQAGLAGVFDALITSDEVGSSKADARIYRAALRELDVAPGATWMVGDSLDWDVAVPQKLGITAIWMVWPAGKFRDMHLPTAALPQNSDIVPDGIVKSLAELLRWL